MDIVSLFYLAESREGVIIGILSMVLLVAIVVFIIASSRSRRLEKRYRVLLGDAEGKDAESLLLDYIARTNALTAQLERTQSDLADLEDVCRGHVQKVGILRYNAFEDIGGEQSFSVALLDAGANGIVVSGLCARDETRVYAKPVRAGHSTHNLSDEEITAIARAIEGYSGAR